MQVVSSPVADHIISLDGITDIDRDVAGIPERFLILNIQARTILDNAVPVDTTVTPCPADRASATVNCVYFIARVVYRAKVKTIVEAVGAELTARVDAEQLTT